MQWFDCNWSQSDYGWNIYVLWMKIIKRRPTKKIHSDVCDTHMPRQQSQQKMDCVYCTYWRMTKETLKVAVIAVNTQHGVFRVSYITPRYFLLFFTFSPSHIFLYIFFTYAKCQLSISFRTPNNKIGIVMIYYTCTSTHHRSITFSRFLLFFFLHFHVYCWIAFILVVTPPTNFGLEIRFLPTKNIKNIEKYHEIHWRVIGMKKSPKCNSRMIAMQKCLAFWLGKCKISIDLIHIL